MSILKFKNKTQLRPDVLSFSDYNISTENISENAKEVIYKLYDNGFEAYLVGGCIRDMMAGVQPKDFDIVTSARPEQIRNLFSNSRLIGRRFRLAHVLFGSEFVEVATFRALHGFTGASGAASNKEGRIIKDNIYGKIEEDVLRRDFTVNSLYMDIQNHTIIDYLGGAKDLANQCIRLIGDPETSYREDPVRILRAIRFSSKLDFKIEGTAAKLIPQFSDSLDTISPSRLFDEAIKIFHCGASQKALNLLIEFDLLEKLFPHTVALLKDTPEKYEPFFQEALRSTDARVQQNLPLNPAFLFCVFLWPVISKLKSELNPGEFSEWNAFRLCGTRALEIQARNTTIPKYYIKTAKDIWALQSRFAQTKKANARKLLKHPKFRAAYDFLCLRLFEDETLSPTCKWWTDIQELPEFQHVLSRAKKAGYQRYKDKKDKRDYR
ncbi:MAG: polynucleotide adenylyltransferase PcnB [Pseudomonadota bacterium]